MYELNGLENARELDICLCRCMGKLREVRSEEALSSLFSFAKEVGSNTKMARVNFAFCTLQDDKNGKALRIT